VNWSDKVVLVTGGTGSFGRKFTEVLLREHQPKKLIVFSRDELKQQEMREQFPDAGDSNIRYFIGDIRDRDRLERAFHGVDLVVHAAAMKQVPACEYNPFEAVKTNVLGTQNVIDAAIDQGVERVFAISTDKAVNPVNIYGATKLCAEKIVVQGNAYAGETPTRLSCVRYGNVVNSRGSVMPIFREQRENGGRLTVTDPRMTRFWVTLDDAVHFVVRCIELMHGGEIFVPKIPSTNIMDVANAIAPECETEITGIRSGEKIHEVLISEDEARHTVELDDMYIVQPAHPWWDVENWPDGRPLVDGFSYSSESNAQWLTAEELPQLIS
jgi:UDP-N-acetylglucosamine 4,6-dehydratase